MSDPFVRPDAPLCVVSLHYDAPLDAIDARMAAHVAWLRKGYDAGLILASGRKVPRTGGVIVMRGDAERVQDLIATDPFVSDGLARAEVTGFTASMAAPALAEMLA
ncbi:MULTISPECIES: YciI family protein [Sphingomonas]|uniref:YciI family protein n=1 Tax=Sphingomonas TaxID=13687 RepID=UPI00193AE503|nr:YciI family protein [Sphingomonas sp. GV3]